MVVGRTPSSFKFEVHHFLDFKEAFLRCSVAESFSRSGIQSLGDPVAVRLGDVGLTRSLRIEELVGGCWS